MFEIVDEKICREGARIKIIGVGGAGGNAIQTMICSQLTGVDFIVANTDLQALEKNKAETKIQIGKKLTRGLGAGANPDVGRQAAIESCELLAQELENVDMVFITAGMGGGTGTGAASIIAEVARQQGVLTVGVVTKPFSFEGRRRSLHADLGIDALKEKVDTLIVIPNDRLLNVSDEQTPILNTFRKADEVLLQAVRGISDLINVHGLINLDFADIRTVMFERGMAIMGIGEAEGKDRALQAADQAIHSPLLDDLSIQGASSIIINVTGNSKLSLPEITQASEFITKYAHKNAEVIFGTVIDDNCGDKVKITVIATGFNLYHPQKKETPMRKQEFKIKPPSQKPKVRERLLEKSRQYRETQNMPQLEMTEKKPPEEQLSIEFSPQEQKKENQNEPFETKSFLKKSLSLFFDEK